MSLRKKCFRTPFSNSVQWDPRECMEKCTSLKTDIGIASSLKLLSASKSDPRLLRDFWETFEGLLRDFWETFERLLRDFWDSDLDGWLTVREWPAQHSQILRCFLFMWRPTQSTICIMETLRAELFIHHCQRRTTNILWSSWRSHYCDYVVVVLYK